MFRVRSKYPLNRGSQMDHPSTPCTPPMLSLFAERTTDCFFPWLTSASPAGKKPSTPNGWALFPLNVAISKPLPRISVMYTPERAFDRRISPKTNLVKLNLRIDLLFSDFLVSHPLPSGSRLN